MESNSIKTFTDALASSIEAGTFVKLTLGNYRGTDPHLQKLLVRLVRTKKGARLFFLYRYEARDTAKNFEFPQGIKIVGEALSGGFSSGHLFTTQNDFQLDVGKRGRSRLNVGKPTFSSAPDPAHDRKKKYAVDPNRFYLKALGIATDHGGIRIGQQDKWKQINKFIETLSALIQNSPVNEKEKVRIVDMGSGKGYLTFAAYDYFQNLGKFAVEVIGVDNKQQLVTLGNDIAASCGFDGLKFVHGTIDSFELSGTDILIALHACDTATDDAIFKGITAGADLIVCAPCCHKEIRPQIKPPEMLQNILKHGIILEREAETLTDGLRALLMEKNGYSTKIFEFISTEHTPKNKMIAGTRHQRKVNADELSREIGSIKDFYGIKELRLEALLAGGKQDTGT